MSILRKKVQYVEALQQTECGLSCVCMILRYYKSHETLLELRSYLEIGRDGSTLKQLNSLMKRLNFDTKIYKGTVEGLRYIQLPAILFCGDNHFIVLERIDQKYGYIVDPQYGRRKMPIEELRSFFSGYVLTGCPNENFIHKKREDSVWKYFFLKVCKKKALFIKIIILSTATYLLTLSIPIFTQKLIDNVATKKDVGFISNSFILLAVFSLVYVLLYFFKGLNLIRLKVHIDETVSTNIFGHLLKVPYKFFDVRNKYDIIYSLNGSLILREIFANQTIKGIIDCGAIVVIVIYMLLQSRLLACISIALFLINIIMLIFVQTYISEYNKYLVTEQSKVQGAQVEAVFSIQGIKMTAIENDIYDNWYNKFKYYLGKYMGKEKINNFVDTLISFIGIVSPLVILSTGVYLTTLSKITIGQAVGFYSISNTFFSLANSVSNTWIGFINSGQFLERIGDIVSTKIESESQQEIKADISGSVQLDNVSFSYSMHSKHVLKNISLSIKTGEKIAIVGRSGCGKSTLAKLLVGLYTPTEGKIFYDDIELDKLEKKHLRKQMGIVPQDVSLFNKSIYDNITMNREDITFEEVEKACKMAQISEDIDQLPMGYNTIVSEMGMNISGGQRQRIALARAIVKEPKILILDEATSSLDNVNERIVADYLKDIGSTRIIIAHRLSTIIDADRIFVLDDGELVEQGTHSELMKKEGYYARLYLSKDSNNYVPLRYLN